MSLWKADGHKGTLIACNKTYQDKLQTQGLELMEAIKLTMEKLHLEPYYNTHKQAFDKRYSLIHHHSQHFTLMQPSEKLTSAKNEIKACTSWLTYIRKLVREQQNQTLSHQCITDIKKGLLHNLQYIAYHDTLNKKLQDAFESTKKWEENKAHEKAINTQRKSILHS